MATRARVKTGSPDRGGRFFGPFYPHQVSERESVNELAYYLAILTGALCKYPTSGKDDRRWLYYAIAFIILEELPAHPARTVELFTESLDGELQTTPDSDMCEVVERTLGRVLNSSVEMEQYGGLLEDAREMLKQYNLPAWAYRVKEIPMDCAEKLDGESREQFECDFKRYLDAHDAYSDAQTCHRRELEKFGRSIVALCRYAVSSNGETVYDLSLWSRIKEAYFKK